MEIITILVISFFALGYAIWKLCFIEDRNKVRKEFENEKILYEVKPLVRMTAYWENLNDFPNLYKAQTLFFSDLEEMKLFASYQKNNSKDLWKLYIISKDDSEIRIVFVELNSLDIVHSVERRK